jgi:hypothetical protein
MLSAIITAVAARKKTRKSAFANDVKARCPAGGSGAVVAELNADDASFAFIAASIVAESAENSSNAAGRQVESLHRPWQYTRRR